MTLTVRKVESQADFKAFFEFPWTLYQDDPYWTPTLLSMRRETLDPAKNPSWEYLDGDYYVAWRAEQPAGTIAAFVNHRHNEFHDENIAWFGFFECGDDQDVAHALLQTAVDWAREQGYDAVRGPQSFTTHEECGLLVEGFQRPVMLMPYNPPYYQRLIEASGFHKVMDVYSFLYEFQDQQVDDRIRQRMQKVIERIKRRNDITIRPIDRKHTRRDFALFKSIYNEAWEANWGFTPMTERELDALIDSLVQFFDPDLACFVEVGDETAGFILGVPDFNQVLHRAYARPGVPEIWTLLRALWHWKLRPKINWMRVPLMGIRQKYRGIGLDILMYDYIRQQIAQGNAPYTHMDCGWILETNQDLIGIMQKGGLEIYKTHRFYEAPVSR